MRLVPGPVGRLSFTEILDTSLKVSWEEPVDKNGIITGEDLVFFSFVYIILYRLGILFYIEICDINMLFYVDLKWSNTLKNINQYDFVCSSMCELLTEI